MNRHPLVLQGKKSAESVLCEFYETLQASHSIQSDHPDGVLSIQEFVEYYKNISFFYDTDAEFAALLSHTWNTVAPKKVSPYKQTEPTQTSQP